MNNCATYPFFVPTTVQIRNLDAVDVSATNFSCDNFTLQGEPLSTVWQNIDESSPGQTVFTGELKADSLVATGTLDAQGGITTTGNLTQTGSSTTATLNTLTAATITSTGNITQSSGSASLKATSVTSMACSGNITQSAGTTMLKATLVDSFATTGNIVQSSGTATLKATAVDSLSSTGNIVQSGGTATLKATTVDSLTVTGTATFGSSVTQSITTSNATLGNVLANTVVATNGISAGQDSFFDYDVDVDGTLTVNGSFVSNPHSYFNNKVTIKNDVSVDSGVLYVDTTNNRVGVNQTTPTVALDVTGDIKLTGSIIAAVKALMNMCIAASSTQSISNTTWTIVKFTGIQSGVDNGTTLSSTTASNSAVGITYTTTNGYFTNLSGSARVFLVSGNVQFATNTSGFRGVRITLSTGVSLNTDIRNTVTGTSAYLNFSQAIYLANNAYFSIQVYQNTGAALNIESSTNDLTQVSVISLT